VAKTHDEIEHLSDPSSGLFAFSRTGEPVPVAGQSARSIAHSSQAQDRIEDQKRTKRGSKCCAVYRVVKHIAVSPGVCLEKGDQPASNSGMLIGQYDIKTHFLRHRKIAVPAKEGNQATTR